MRAKLLLAVVVMAASPSLYGQSSSGNYTISGSVVTNTGGSGGGSGVPQYSENYYCSPSEVASFGTDGPATGPQTCNYTARSASPSSGTVRTVNVAADLTAALTAAACGDIIQLTAGITVVGNFLFPTKSCDSAHWITIRTSGFASLPPESTRVTPCYFGAASLPGRPNFNCGSTTKFGATIQASGNGSKPLTFASGIHFVRIIGIEFMPDPANTAQVSPLVVTGNGNMDHVVFDQIWAHGNVSDEVTRFTLLQNSNHVSIVNSFFTDFKCITISGSCTEAQVISGGTGGVGTDGTYKIYNNFMEAAGENILIGGGGGTTTPFDFEIRQNHLFLPLTWNPNDPSYNGGVSGNSFTMKNKFELKNAQRVFVEGNVSTNAWCCGQFGQVFTLTPKTQNGANLNAKVTDIIIRYNTSTDSAAAFEVNNSISGVTLAAGGNRYSIHDNLFVDVGDVNSACNGCGPTSIGMGDAYSNYTQTAGAPDLIHDVLWNHNTVVYATVNPPGQTWPQNGFLIDGPVGALQTNYTFTNSITMSPAALGFGGGNGCAFGHGMVDVTGWMNACWTPGTWTMTNNVFVEAVHTNKNWPAGNFLPTAYSLIGFVNYNNGAGGDYRLCTGVNLPAAPCAGASAYHNAGTDGLDLGVDMTTLNTLTTGFSNP